MTAAKWQRIQEVFHQACELAPEAVDPFLAAACVDDPDLLAEVRKLLSAVTANGSLIEGTLQQAAAELMTARTADQIGPYQVLQPLGSGGMGTVYLAARNDNQFRKQVAIKLIRSEFAGPSLIQRFQNERQILATLDHPYVARLLDGGATASGVPYLVMEYIEGQPLDVYAQERRLSVADRLRLFVRICEAVSYAHGHLVVHRDLKPANILVTKEGIPKLLDFGIAKVLDAESIGVEKATRPTERLLTLEYASPEQIRGGAITTATDVYSLGIVLYELLSGQKPFQFGDLWRSEVERRICEELPQRPSTAAKGSGAPAGARRALRGDLDNIVMRAVRKEPERRYASVDAFAADINRYLGGYPVLARRESWHYVARKFVVRNRIALTAASLMTGMLLAGLVITREAQLQAQRSFEQALSMANSSLFEVHDAIADLPGSLQARALLVRRTLSQLDSLASHSGNPPAIQRELAAAYEKLADIQYRVGVGRLGDSAGALVNTRRALEMRKSLARPGSLDDRLAIAADYARLADVQQLTRSLSDSLGNYREALRNYQEVAKADGASASSQEKIARTEMRLGETERLNGNMGKAAEYISSARRAYEALLAVDPGNRSLRSGLVDVTIALAELQTQAGNLTQASQTLQQARIIARAQVADRPGDVPVRAQLASVLNHAGNTLVFANQPKSALESYRESEAIIRELAAENPADGRLQRSVAIHNTNVAIVLEKMGSLSEAESRYRRSVSIHSALLTKDPSSAQHKDDLAYVGSALGGLLAARGRFVEANERLEEAVDLRLQLIAQDPANTTYQQRLSRTYERLGELAVRQEKWPEARQRFGAARELLTSLQGRMNVSDAIRRLDGRLKLSPERLAETIRPSSHITR